MEERTIRQGKDVVLIKNGYVLSMAGQKGLYDILIEDGKVQKLSPGIKAPEGARVVDARGCFILPGFVQTHVHLCQTLWRNLADGVDLMEWLKRFTWPLEANLTEEDARISARLACAELLLSGTTAVADMGTVRHTEAIVEAATNMGMKGLFSKVLMDAHDGPKELREDPEASVLETLTLVKRFNEAQGLIRIALAPRFAVSSSRRLLEMVAEVAQEQGLYVHTHCAETESEVSETVARFGKRPVALFQDLGLLGERLLLAHCVHLTEEEIKVIADSGTTVLHCPSANLKLGSGIAPIKELVEAGAKVTLGADGAPCNNNLSIFTEMRLAALLQSVRYGPTAPSPEKVLRMATIEGAKAIGMGDLLGSIEPGKFADLVILEASEPGCVPYDDEASCIVFSMGRHNVRHVLIQGRFKVEDGRLVGEDVEDLVCEAKEASLRLLRRAGLRAT